MNVIITLDLSDIRKVGKRSNFEIFPTEMFLLIKLFVTSVGAQYESNPKSNF